MSRKVSGSRVPVFSLGERIRKAREDLGLSQQEMADQLGVHRKTVNNWETGRNEPRYRDLMLLSSIADVSLEWLAGELFRPQVGREEAAATSDNSQGTGPETRRYRQPAMAA